MPSKELVLVGGLGESLILGPGHRLPVIAQVLAVRIAWAFALGGWWYASHSTVLGSARFCPAELAGRWMPGGYSCCLAQMQCGLV